MKELKIKMFIDMSKVKFTSEEQHKAFLYALGRQVFYGAKYAPDVETTDMKGGISIGQDMSDVEICFTYTPYLDDMPIGKGFTMAAIARDNGETYSYHS